jgi:hypothetical protein
MLRGKDYQCWLPVVVVGHIMFIHHLVFSGHIGISSELLNFLGDLSLYPTISHYQWLRILTPLVMIGLRTCAPGLETESGTSDRSSSRYTMKSPWNRREIMKLSSFIIFLSFFYHLLSSFIIFYHLLSFLFIMFYHFYHLLSSFIVFIIFYHILPFFIIFYHLLSSFIIFYRLLSSFIIFYHLLSSFIIFYHLL